MSNRVTRADIMEVPLPAGGIGDGLCMPMVIMQPTADASDYMLKPNYATNGRPGVVDHAVIADEASTVVWSTITNLPSVFPPAPHGPQHLAAGNDGIPNATPQSNGLCPAGDGQPNDYLGGDIVFHQLPGLLSWRGEAPVTLDASFVSGAVLASGIINNPVPGVYEVEECYLYNVNPAYPPAGQVHFNVYDPSIPGWVAVSAVTDISVMTTATYLLRPILLSAAMIRVFSAQAMQLQWQLVLDQSASTTCYFRAGVGFRLFGLTTTIP
jgi:hypothetical protein